MDMLFPLNARVQKGNVSSFVAVLIVYIIASVVLGVIGFFIGFVPFIRILYSFIAGLLGLYILIGVILAAVKCFANNN